jgi:hypothetical protein
MRMFLTVLAASAMVAGCVASPSPYSRYSYYDSRDSYYGSSYYGPRYTPYHAYHAPSYYAPYSSDRLK